MAAHALDKRRAFADVNHVQPAIPAGGEDRGRVHWVGLLGPAELPKPPVLAVRGVRVLAERLAVAGYEVVWRDEVPGQDHVLPKRCHTADPFGNRLEFLEPR